MILFFPRQEPRIADHPARRIEATLAPRPSAPPAAEPPAAAPAEIAPFKPQVTRKLLALEKSEKRLADAAPPAWSKAEREDMNKFLRELDDQAKAGPDLAQRSLNMARAAGRQQARRDDEDDVLLERLPNSPPVDPFSLEMYLDGLVKKLNRSAAFVRNDPRSRGMKTAAVLIRLNPNGSLRSFRVLNAGDQQAEIEFIRSVVERAVPFSAFPADIQKSAQSLAMIICILPAHLGGGGFGFARIPDGSRC
ncbi:hypothetical protein [Sulfurisoma sediminicola]|uniref:TonB family protein n=1 Tax=Sulfurisoma sediminicola TaxID=1381557 RepID=A0A497XER9_9PROT|nr:hypothetical protein [Sulfurisoma sediminicola]RLJ65035.1 hypothetical protein DFR35_1691 [Sulfurisoma sediminicola]